MIRFSLFLLLISGSVINLAAQVDPVMHFGFNEASGTATTTEDVSQTQFSINNNLDFPERIQAVQGTALRLDGFSTYAGSDFSITQIDKQISIEAWYATEAFSPSTDGDRKPIDGGAIISQIHHNEGFALTIGPYGNISFTFHADGHRYVIRTANQIKKYAWNHIVATADLASGKAGIFVNGSLWEESIIQTHQNLTFASVPLFIGRHNTEARFAGFNLNTLNGAIDDLKVYNTVLSASDIKLKYEEFAPQVVTEELFEDFEGPDYGNWSVSGAAFGSHPANGTLANQQPVSGFRGNQLVNSFNGGDVTQGIMISPEFTIQHDLINFLVGGGNHPGKAAVRLRVNGEIVRSATGRNSEALFPASWDVSGYKGQLAKIEVVDSVTGGWGHILVDHITFSDSQELLEADLYIDPAVRHAGDYLRPQYHAIPNTSWTNEAYGLTYYNGKYHLFFQKNPNGPYLFFMHWGHLSSPDMVHWKEEKIALAPSPGFDDFGIWSGATIMDQNNEPVIFYTGVDVGRAGIGIAHPKDADLIEWEKFDGNPVIPNGPGGYLDFRDPFVWEDNGTYYMIVGAGFAGNGGGALPTYKSTDLKTWTRISNLFSSSNLTDAGFFWEMPLFFPLNDKGDYILSVTPLFTNRPANVIYWIGKWENDRFVPYFEKPKLMEPVRDNMLAPAIGKDEEGRINYIGIIPETRSDSEQIRAGWRHAFSLPRVIRLLDDNTIGHYPHPNLCRLRANEVEVLERKITKGTNNNLPELSGNQSNFAFKVKADSASRFELQVLKSEDGTQRTTFIFDLERNVVILDSRYAHEKTGAKEYKTSEYIYDYKELINIEVFVDRSIVEVFVDNLLVLSTRAYPSESSKGVDLRVIQGGVEIMEARQWDMQAMRTQTGSEVCEPESLPSEFRKVAEPPVTGLDKAASQKFLNLYPNPASGVIKIQPDAPVFEARISVTDMSGKEVLAVKKNFSGAEEVSIDVNILSPGIYMMRLETGKKEEFGRFIIMR